MFKVSRFAFAVAICGLARPAVVLVAQTSSPPSQVLPLGPARERGSSVTPAFEGWYQNEDGSFSLLVGYFNRNKSETLDIPVGPNNKLEPGPVDQGQPTHFQTGRQWGVFVVKVPKDFGTRAITWTITSNGETQSIPLTLNRNYPIEPFEEKGMGNKPPVLTFGGSEFTGPPTAVAAAFTGTVGQPVVLTLVVSDPKQTKQGSEARAARGAGTVATVSFHKFRGPGAVKFDPARVAIKAQGETVTASATFSLPGQYLVRVQGNDESGEGGGGFQCCWTNTYVQVTVK